MKNLIATIQQLITPQDFKKQLVGAIAIAIIAVSVISTIMITRLSTTAISENLSEKGEKITEAFADQTILGLLVSDASNVKDAVQNILQFPDVAGVGIYDISRTALIEQGLTISISEFETLPTQAELISQTPDAWHFVAPVFYVQESEDDFFIEQSVPELLGYVLVEMQKSSLNKLVEGIRNLNIIITLLLAMVLMLVVLSITQKIIKPIKELMMLMGKAQKGERKVVAELKGPRDIQQMESAFNTMIVALEDREAELLSTRDKALESAKIKGEFAANVSHELRTPLNGILGMLELLSGMGLSSKQREYINIARSSSDALLILIDDILDFSKIDSGRLEILNAEFNLYDLMEDVVSIMSTQAQVKDIDLTYIVCDPVPTYIKGDVRRIRQLLINLCGNAIKFTSKGEVSIRILLVKQTQANIHLRFEVEDTGIGIPETALEKIFDAFSQADNSTTRKYGGTGLGLAICRQLVHALEGEIGVQSRENVGSIFYFILPMQHAIASKTISSYQDHDFSQARLLVVDDCEHVRLTVCNMLKNWGAQADAVDSGEMALKYLREAQQNHTPYNIVIVDESMPSINGIELLCNIADESEISQVSRLLMTNQTHTESFLERFNEIDAFLQKPVLQSNLYDYVIALLKGVVVNTTKQAGLELDKQFIANDIRVLVAEDNAANQEVAIGMLERLGCKVVIAFNGVEAINLLLRERFDLVLMDCNMPEMDGYKATHEIRKLKDGNAQIPIIAMTANVQEGDRQKCIEAGMNDYLAKPLKIKNIRNQLETWIPDAISEVLDNSSEAKASDITAIDLIGSFSIKRINELQESVGDAFDAMLAVFIEDIQKSVRMLSAAIVKKDFEAIRLHAHSIKGSCKNFGAHELVNIAREVEDMCKSGVIQTPDEIVEKLDQEVSRVVAGLEGIESQKSHENANYPKKDNTQTILIADDDRSMRVALMNILDADGYQLFEVTDGHQAVNFCKNNMPDLVLLDAVMPEMSGLEACKKIRQIDQSSHVPILIVTALDDEESVEHAFRVGATDYLSKPVHFSVLRQRIARLLHASKVEKHVRQLAYTDSLTGLPNRTTFSSQLMSMLAKASKTEKIAILFLDLNRFKLVNDTLGHSVGDLLLKAVADRIRRCVHSGDMVARLGGDEFAVIIDRVKSQDSLSRIANTICETLDKPFSFAGKEIFVSTSIGIAIFPDDGTDIDSLMKHADAAMFRAKDFGRNYMFYGEHGGECYSKD